MVDDHTTHGRTDGRETTDGTGDHGAPGGDGGGALLDDGDLDGAGAGARRGREGASGAGGTDGAGGDTSATGTAGGGDRGREALEALIDAAAEEAPDTDPTGTPTTTHGAGATGVGAASGLHECGDCGGRVRLVANTREECRDGGDPWWGYYVCRGCANRGGVRATRAGGDGDGNGGDDGGAAARERRGCLAPRRRTAVVVE